MQVTSQAQFRAAESDSASELEQIRDDLYSIGMEFPGFRPHANLCYLVLADDGVHLIDPGWDSEPNWRRLEGAIRFLGRDPLELRSITITHLHPDHLGMAERVRSETGAVIAMHELEAKALDELSRGIGPAGAREKLDSWAVPEDRRAELLEALDRRSKWKRVSADVLLSHGDLLDIPGIDLEVLHTPGHTSGHVSIADRERKLIFTGDHLLPNQFSGVGLGGTSSSNPIDDYFDSLDLLADFEDFEVLPGHGYRFLGITERAEAIRAHHSSRSAEVAAIDSGLPAWRVAEQLSWTDGWSNLRGLALLSALAQTELHLLRLKR